MRVRQFLVATTLLTITLVSGKAHSAATVADTRRDEEKPGSRVFSHEAADIGSKNEIRDKITELLADVPSPLLSKDRALGLAYLNTLTILSTRNTCSDFFGGPAAAADVFKQLVSKLRRGYFQTSIGITMSGKIVNIQNRTTGANYRLFDKVSINLNGAFYRRRFSQAELQVAGVGTFEPNTKEVRVLMFLHELGHVMKGEDGGWLLPNDGENEALSRRNSQKIEDVCGQQIKSLGNGNSMRDLKND